MAERFLDIPGADALELYDVARETFVEGIRAAMAEEVEDWMESIAGETELLDGTLDTPDLRERLKSMLEDRVRNGLAARCEFNSGYRRGTSAVQLFVDELGRRGWEILPPPEVRRVKVAARFFAAFRQSRLPDVIPGVKIQLETLVK